jgi:hypothetical protein
MWHKSVSYSSPVRNPSRSGGCFPAPFHTNVYNHEVGFASCDLWSDEYLMCHGFPFLPFLSYPWPKTRKRNASKTQRKTIGVLWILYLTISLLFGIFMEINQYPVRRITNSEVLWPVSDVSIDRKFRMRSENMLCNAYTGWFSNKGQYFGKCYYRSLWGRKFMRTCV